MSSRIVYLNGKFLPLQEAHISVMDRGFLFGDGVYEVIPVFNGRLFRPEAHLRRFKTSLAAVRLDVAFEEEAFIAIIEQLLAHNPEQGDSRSVYLQITRGVAENRDHSFPEHTVPTIFMQCTPFTPASEESLSQGAKAITAPDIRWSRCYIKAITLLPNVLLVQQALEVGAKEAIMIRDGMAMEGVASNLFMVKDGALITPPADHAILCGVTRDLILEIAEQQGVPFFEQNIPQQCLREADEIWMTGSLKEILPIVQIDDYCIGTGKVGVMWQKFFNYYQAYKNNQVL